MNGLRAPFSRAFLYCALAACACLAAPKPAAQAEAVLNQARIHGLYNDGDFDRVVALIDSFTAVRKSYSVYDSVFIAKHLAVVYTANPATREKGKAYMFLLLDLLPSAKIVDMYVSEEIDRIFDKVKEEFTVREKLKADMPSNPEEVNQHVTDRMNPNPDSMPRTPRARDEAKSYARKGLNAKYWLAGGAAVVAIAGTASWFLLRPSEKATETTYVMP